MFNNSYKFRICDLPAFNVSFEKMSHLNLCLTRSVSFEGNPFKIDVLSNLVLKKLEEDFFIKL